jgi:hypothetical protein
VSPSAAKETRAIGDANSLIQSLLALPELRMRVLWLEDRIYSRPTNTLATILNEIAERAQSTDERAREAMLVLAIFIAQRRESALVWALREEARSRSLLSLERMVRERVETHVADVELEPKVPDYGTGRELTVGERKSLARRPTRLQIDRLLLDPHPLVLEQLFQCPALTEDDILRIATRRPARLTALELLVTSSRWMARRRVRMSLILNPGTPHALALPLVSTCPRDDLLLIIGTTNLSKTLRAVAHELYSRLPPVKSVAPHPHHH